MGTTDPTDGRTYEDEGARDDQSEESLYEGSYWGFSLGALLFGVGAVLFVIPEPTTSVVGAALALVSVVVLVVEAMS